MINTKHLLEKKILRKFLINRRKYLSGDYEEKNMSHEFKPNEIFKASDLMVDSLTQLISKKRQKQQKN